MSKDLLTGPASLALRDADLGMRQSAEQRLHSCEQPPLRIALVASSYNYIKDGVALTLNRLVAYLERQGVEVLVFAPVGKIPAFTHRGTVVPVPLAGMVGGNDRDLQALCDPPCGYSPAGRVPMRCG